ncbi:hypothetical protein FRB96_000192 [Tulasnella sp. 330]|nr:hypothetical protein FRB96_000192 [Tulasnella sp. 330]
MSFRLRTTLLLSILFSSCNAVTIYTTLASGYATTSAAYPISSNGAYNQEVLSPPTPPTGLSQQWAAKIQPANTLANLSISHKGNFIGFSVELSVVGQVLGVNSSFLQPPFLNHLANIKERAGAGPIVRIGGNTQDQAIMYNKTFLDGDDPQMISKYQPTVNGNPTGTPEVDFAVELFYAMGNITKLLNVDWYFGLQFINPYNNTNALEAATIIQEVLGDHLISLQLGNEPDLYADHKKRPSNYSIQDYFSEYVYYLSSLDASGAPNKKTILGPSVATGPWSCQDLINAGYLTEFQNYLNVWGLMHYPSENCPGLQSMTSQQVLPTFLTHSSALAYSAEFAPIVPEVMAAGLPIVILETNTASCGGFPGLSDAFTSSLWAIASRDSSDNALMLAATNISTFLLHVGGHGENYNPFTPPPTNISSTYGWTTGAVYYAALAVAETFGSSNASQIVDMNLPSEFRPGYAIYEDGLPTRVALINYASDDTGASDYDAVIQIAGTTVPNHVNVRYLSAPSVSEKYNITWAGQTMGGQFESDGRLQGTQETKTIECDQANNQCIVPMRAPSFALVFLTDDAMARSTAPQGSASLTFATTATTDDRLMIAPSVLAKMNGSGGPVNTRPVGNTGKSQSSAGISRSSFTPVLNLLCGVIMGCLLVLV